MNENDDWIRDIVPDEDVDNLNAKAQRIESDHDTYYELSFYLSRPEAIKTCQQFALVQEGQPFALVHMFSILTGIVDSIEFALSTDDINPYEEDDVE
jgi:hypothetical protein